MMGDEEGIRGGLVMILALIGGSLFLGGYVAIRIIVSGSISSMDIILASNRVALPNDLIKVAVAGDDDVKEIATIIMTKKKPHELAISPETYQVTSENIDKLNDFLSGEEVNTGIYMDIFYKCQSWLTVSAPGSGEFIVDNDIINKYYGGLTEEGLTMLNPVYLSEKMQEYSDTINTLCGETGCPNTRTCAGCWALRNSYVEAEAASDYAAVRLIENQMMQVGCGRSCAEVCSTIYPRMSMALSTNPEVRKDLISMGIQLS